MRNLLVVLVVCAAATAVALPTPDEFLGKGIGEDRYLAPWPQVVSYLETVDAASGRVTIESAGESTLGNDIPVVILTTEDNQRRLDEFRDIARRLAHPQNLSTEDARRLIKSGKTIVLVTCTIHASEVGATQMSMELVHRLATTDDPEVLGWMEDVILLIMPSINPDGQVLVVDWYNKTLGTEFEGTRMPWLYHHYVGHDNNRDFYMLTQKETRAVNQVLYHRWFPQIFLDEHQMGSTGPRMFVPPQTDPLAPEVHSLIFRQADLLGTSMAIRLEEAGKRGVGSNMIFDSYWPGGTRNTAWWKNVTGLLTEVASARRASPIFIDPGELRGGSKGLPEYQRRANFPSPWPGGWWRLRDIIDYEMVATMSVLETASRDRVRFLNNIYQMASEAIDRGRREPPFGFLIPPAQHDVVAADRLLRLLVEHGVHVETAREPFAVGRELMPAGTAVIRADQAYRPFLLTMMRPQRYPEVRAYRGGPVLPPYDATSWSLPVGMGVEVVEASVPFAAKTTSFEDPRPSPARLKSGDAGFLMPHSADSVFAAMNLILAAGAPVYWLQSPPDGGAPGDVWVSPDALTDVRLRELSEAAAGAIRPATRRPTGAAWRVEPTTIGLYKPWQASMDEGWTRFLLDEHGFSYVSLDNDAIQSGAYRENVGVVLLTDETSTILENGRPSSPRAARRWTPLPPEFSGGLGREGGEELTSWIRAGGTVVALNRSTEWVIDLLELPVENVVDGAGARGFACPGSMLRLLMDRSHPMTFGMRAEEAGYFSRSPAFRTRVPDPRFKRTVVARYPDDRRDILVSGHLEGGEVLEKRAAVVDFRVGAGRVVLIGFKPQNRAQTHRTFKLLFNALMLPGLKPVELE